MAKQGSRKMAKTGAKRKAAPEQPGEGAYGTTAFEARGDVLDTMRKALDRSAADAGGGGASFIKLDQKSNRLRIAQGEDPDKPWVVVFRQHRGQVGDRFQTWLDLGWLLQGERAFGTLAAAIGEEDREKVATFGDPAATIAAAVRRKVGGKLDDLPKDLKDAKFRPWSEKRALFTAIQGGQPGLLETGGQLYESIAALAEESPEAFQVVGGYDIVISTNGQTGFKKRYLGANIPPGQRPSTAEYQGAWPDTLASLRKRVPTFRQKLEFAVANYAKFMSYGGVTKKDLGG